MPFTFLYRWKWAHCGENASILSGEMSEQSGFLLIPIKLRIINSLKKTYKSKRNYNKKAPVTLKTNVMMKRKKYFYTVVVK